MLRIGQVVKGDENFLMNVSPNYEDVVKKLSQYSFSSKERELLACLVISQTEKQYKNYLIKALLNIGNLNIERLVEDWQKGNMDVEDEGLQSLLTKGEYELLSGLNLEDHLEKYDERYPNLFDDGLSKDFYPKKKKGSLYIRRLVKKQLTQIGEHDDFKKLIVFFIMAQLLTNWEPSCIHLGKMLLEDWEISKMCEWFSYVWPIYFNK
ncbi:hypothetical protein A2Z67_01575 [Candidatus Woesebacteria bacterium RBG_13_36_22]|uniref:Uncharacterized protein n=1 Tax=Candidatus Woesebacteria bacterium RBG_13_36_22 TaxID=1802478 RepID=A0A1F7X366_9BACT|nr:MAG: hypothetical protein A2Z67_01575 [Candidatus Woesebacteria bacterium RBG_13_36_22]